MGPGRPAPSHLAVRVHTFIHRVGVIVEAEVIPHHCLPFLQGSGISLLQGHFSRTPGRTQLLWLEKDQNNWSYWHSLTNPFPLEQPLRWKGPVLCLSQLTRPPPEFNFLLLATSGRRERNKASTLTPQDRPYQAAGRWVEVGLTWGHLSQRVHVITHSEMLDFRGPLLRDWGLGTKREHT